MVCYSILYPQTQFFRLDFVTQSLSKIVRQAFTCFCPTMNFTHVFTQSMVLLLHAHVSIFMDPLRYIVFLSVIVGITRAGETTGESLSSDPTYIQTIICDCPVLCQTLVYQAKPSLSPG